MGSPLFPSPPISAPIAKMEVGVAVSSTLKLSRTDSFFRLKVGSGSASGRLLSLELQAGTNTAVLAADVMRLLSDLRPRALSMFAS